MLNKAILMGRLTADPTLKTTPSGVSVTSFTLAVERDFKDKQTGDKITDFLDIVAWKGTAEFACKYFSKGRMMAVVGSLQSRKWKDKDGNNRTSIELVADEVHFADSKSSADDGLEF